MRIAPSVRLLITAATLAASLSTVAVSTPASAAARRGFADSLADAGYVTLHAHATSYTVKAHQQIAVSLRGVPTSDVVAVSVGLTVKATGTGGVTLWRAGTKRPAAVTESFTAGTSAAGTVVAPGRLSLLNSSAHGVKVTLVARGYFPSAATAFASGAPGWFVAAPAKKAVSVRMPAHTSVMYNALLGAPPRIASIVLAVSAIATKSGRLTSYPVDSAYKTHTALPLVAGKRTQAIEVVQPSGASHLVGMSNLSRGPASVTASSVGYVQPFQAPSQAQYLLATAGPASGTITVTWQPPLRLGGMPITSYQVRVYPNGPTSPSDGSVTSVTGTSAVLRLPAGRGYWFGVTGVTAVGVGSEMRTNTPVQPLPVVAPSAPRNVTAVSAGVGQVTVSWSPPVPNGGQPVTTYTVAAAGMNPLTVPATSTSVTLPWRPGLSGFFSVSATSPDGTSQSAKAAVVTALGVPDSGVTTRASAPLAAGAASITQVTGGERPSMSTGGRYVAFSSRATDLVAGDTNNARDVYVRDVVTGTTTRVSVASSGAQGNGDSLRASISNDGRYVVFESMSTNLATGATDGNPHVYRHDLQTGHTDLVSLTATDGVASGAVPTMSGDGDRIAFESDQPDVVNNDTNDTTDIFVRDVAAGTTARVSLSGTGAELDGFSEGAAISADGNVVAFSSYASNVVVGFSPYAEQLYVRNLSAGTTTAVSRGFDGMTGNDDSYGASVSSDGRYVAFVSGAGNLVSDDSGGGIDVFVRDVQSGTTTRVDVTNSGAQTTGALSYTPVSISADGQRVAFELPEAALIAVGAGTHNGVFVRDLTAGTTTEVSVATDGTRPSAGAAGAGLSPDGHFAGFAAGFGSATNPVDGITTPGVFLRNLG